MSGLIFSRAVGVIGKPHGVKGYVYVRMFTDYPDSIKKDSILYLDEKCMVKARVVDIRMTISGRRQRTILSLYGIQNREEAEELRNKVLYRKPEDQPETDENTFWIDDLFGCEIFLNDGTSVGTVTNVEKFAHNDNLSVKTGSDTLLIIPLLDEYIDKIDIEKKKIILKKLPEFA